MQSLWRYSLAFGSSSGVPWERSISTGRSSSLRMLNGERSPWTSPAPCNRCSWVVSSFRNVSGFFGACLLSRGAGLSVPIMFITRTLFENALGVGTFTPFSLALSKFLYSRWHHAKIIFLRCLPSPENRGSDLMYEYILLKFAVCKRYILTASCSFPFVAVKTFASLPILIGPPRPSSTCLMIMSEIVRSVNWSNTSLYVFQSSR